MRARWRTGAWSPDQKRTAEIRREGVHTGPSISDMTALDLLLPRAGDASGKTEKNEREEEGRDEELTSDVQSSSG